MRGSKQLGGAVVVAILTFCLTSSLHAQISSPSNSASGSAGSPGNNADGSTLLYSYTTTNNGPYVTSGGAANSGYYPFSVNPVYIDYRPSGYGATIISR